MNEHVYKIIVRLKRRGEVEYQTKSDSKKNQIVNDNKNRRDVMDIKVDNKLVWVNRSL
jgi:hypothetical protein